MSEPNGNGNGKKVTLDRSSAVSLGLLAAIGLPVLFFSLSAYGKMADVSGAVALNTQRDQYTAEKIDEIGEDLKQLSRAVTGLPSREDFSILAERVRVLETKQQ